MYNSKKGFTFIEVIISLSFVAMFLILIIGIPTLLVRESKGFTAKVDKCQIISNTIKTLSNDISKSSGNVQLSNNVLTIDNITYTFSSTGIIRKSSYDLRLSDIESSAQITDNKLYISIGTEDKKDIIDFNLNANSLIKR